MSQDSSAPESVRQKLSVHARKEYLKRTDHIPSIQGGTRGEVEAAATKVFKSLTNLLPLMTLCVNWFSRKSPIKALEAAHVIYSLVGAHVFELLEIPAQITGSLSTHFGQINLGQRATDLLTKMLAYLSAKFQARFQTRGLGGNSLSKPEDQAKIKQKQDELLISVREALEIYDASGIWPIHIMDPARVNTLGMPILRSAMLSQLLKGDRTGCDRAIWLLKQLSKVFDLKVIMGEPVPQMLGTDGTWEIPDDYDEALKLRNTAVEGAGDGDGQNEILHKTRINTIIELLNHYLMMYILCDGDVDNYWGLYVFCGSLNVVETVANRTRIVHSLLSKVTQPALIQFMQLVFKTEKREITDSPFYWNVNFIYNTLCSTCGGRSFKNITSRFYKDSFLALANLGEFENKFVKEIDPRRAKQDVLDGFQYQFETLFIKGFQGMSGPASINLAAKNFYYNLWRKTGEVHPCIVTQWGYEVTKRFTGAVFNMVQNLTAIKRPEDILNENHRWQKGDERDSPVCVAQLFEIVKQNITQAEYNQYNALPPNQRIPESVDNRLYTGKDESGAENEWYIFKLSQASRWTWIDVDQLTLNFDMDGATGGRRARFAAARAARAGQTPQQASQGPGNFLQMAAQGKTSYEQFLAQAHPPKPVTYMPAPAATPLYNPYQAMSMHQMYHQGMAPMPVPTRRKKEKKPKTWRQTLLGGYYEDD